MSKRKHLIQSDSSDSDSIYCKNSESEVEEPYEYPEQKFFPKRKLNFSQSGSVKNSAGSLSHKAGSVGSFYGASGREAASTFTGRRDAAGKETGRFTLTGRRDRVGKEVRSSTFTGRRDTARKDSVGTAGKEVGTSTFTGMRDTAGKETGFAHKQHAAEKEG